MWILILLFIILCLFLLNLFIGKRRTINTWYKTLDIWKHKKNHDVLFEQVDGFSLSRQARSTDDAFEYTYGEIDFVSFIALLSLTKPDRNTIFYDLGSGIGKAVLASAQVFNVKKSCGIERFNLLHQAAIQQQHRLQQHPDYSKMTTNIHFIHADFLTTNIEDATHVFINSTAYFGDLWFQINQLLSQTKAGTYIITTSKPLKSKRFLLMQQTLVKMSWGVVQAFIHARIP